MNSRDARNRILATIAFMILAVITARSHSAGVKQSRASADSDTALDPKGASPSPSSQARGSIETTDALTLEKSTGTFVPAEVPEAEGVLVKAVLDPVRMPDSREQMLHELIGRGPSAISAITEIAASPIFDDLQQLPVPHSLAESRHKFEVALRISALEALDGMSDKDSRVADSMRRVQAQQSDSTLTFLASVSLTGIRQGRPGKLSRMIDKIVSGDIN